MARGKDSSPLFEIIRKADKPSRREMRMPPWMRRQAEEAEARKRQAEAGGEPERQEAGVKADRSAAAAPRRAEADGAGPPEPAGPAASGTGWLKEPLAVRLPRGTWVMLGVVAAVVVAGGYLVGREIGERNAVARQQAYEDTTDSLEAIRERPPSSRLIPSTVAGAGGVNRAGAIADPVDRNEGEDDAAPPPPPGDAGAAGDGGDPRQPGLNYFRLATFPASARDEGERAVAFLGANGLDAAVIPVDNDTVKLIVLEGFVRPYSDPEAERLKERVRTLGRQWEAQQRGASDWSDMFPEKYQPGVN